MEKQILMYGPTGRAHMWLWQENGHDVAACGFKRPIKLTREGLGQVDCGRCICAMACAERDIKPGDRFRLARPVRRK